MKVVWTPEAEQDRATIWDYLEARNPAAAIRIDQLFSAASARLADFPLLGHTGEIGGTRELTPHPSYRLVYENRRGYSLDPGADPHRPAMAADPRITSWRHSYPTTTFAPSGNTIPSRPAPGSP